MTQLVTKSLPTPLPHNPDSKTDLPVSYLSYSLKGGEWLWQMPEKQQLSFGKYINLIISYFTPQDHYQQNTKIATLLNSIISGSFSQQQFYTFYDTVISGLARTGCTPIQLGSSFFLKAGCREFLWPIHDQARLSMIVTICKRRVQGELDKDRDQSAVRRMDDFSMLIVKTYCMEDIRFSDKKCGYSAFRNEFCRRGLHSFRFNKKNPFLHIETFLIHSWNKYNRLIGSWK